MGLFGFGKKKEEKVCDCGGACNAAKTTEEKKETSSAVKVLGSGCKKCNDLEAATVEALESLGMDTAVEHVRDFGEIAAYGVMTTPALVIDNKVASMGKVLKKEEVVEILKKMRA